MLDVAGNSTLTAVMMLDDVGISTLAADRMLAATG